MAHVGIVRTLSYLVAAVRAARQLLPVLEAFEPPAIPASLVYQYGGRKPANLDGFIDAA